MSNLIAQQNAIALPLPTKRSLFSIGITVALGLAALEGLALMIGGALVMGAIVFVASVTGLLINEAMSTYTVVRERDVSKEIGAALAPHQTAVANAVNDLGMARQSFEREIADIKQEIVAVKMMRGRP